ncbi:hypothetical protein LMTR13_25630 [Bradyrhizobium icense]|uniref:Thioesterase domain-containing protein n=2 Tax=Bradyrhizobium icense TaxID=1274631 RepID=A0A1B1UJT8_9BRAD|nr:hypothetical protein LMTR13_25630 [Bradyrhizobium icense]
MSARSYLDVFSDAGVLALRELGFGPPYLKGGHSIFTGDFHITYVREIRAGGSLTVATRILDLDSKRFVFHQEMTGDSNGALAATAEHLQLNVGVASRKVEPFLPEIFERLRGARHGQGASPPRNVGRAASLMAGAPTR